MAPIANEQINIELRLCLYYSFLVLENFLRVIYNQWALHIELTLNSVKFSLFDNIDILSLLNIHEGKTENKEKTREEIHKTTFFTTQKLSILAIGWIDFDREHANQLVKENDQLQDMIRITEKDTIECFTLLQKKDEEKKNEVAIDVFGHMIINLRVL